MKDIKEEHAENYGKFGSAAELLSAYNALESEFTKRCQLLKQLQTELDSVRAQAEQQPSESAQLQASELSEGVAENIVATVAADDTCAAVVADGAEADEDKRLFAEIAARAAEAAEMLCAIPEVMDACIAEYKRRLTSSRTGYCAPTGMAVMTAPARPKTLSDAKALADRLLAQQ